MTVVTLLTSLAHLPNHESPNRDLPPARRQLSSWLGRARPHRHRRVLVPAFAVVGSGHPPGQMTPDGRSMPQPCTRSGAAMTLGQRQCDKIRIAGRANQGNAGSKATGSAPGPRQGAVPLGTPPRAAALSCKSSPGAAARGERSAGSGGGFGELNLEPHVGEAADQVPRVACSIEPVEKSRHSWRVPRSGPSPQASKTSRHLLSKRCGPGRWATWNPSVGWGEGGGSGSGLGSRHHDGSPS